jgi:AcrR family transcriptional regulator
MPRRALNRERVLRAAIRLADKDGIDALSMRRLARELGVEAMSLYNHIANKDELLTGMADLVAKEVELPSSEEADWKIAIRRSSISTRDVLLRHRWASGLWMSQKGGGPARLRHEDWILRTLREAGLRRELVYHALHILDAYVLGFTRMQLNMSALGDDLSALAEGFLRQLREDEYPDFADHVRQHLDPPEGEEGGFELGLDLILDGLERTRDAT